MIDENIVNFSKLSNFKIDSTVKSCKNYFLIDVIIIPLKELYLGARHSKDVDV